MVLMPIERNASFRVIKTPVGIRSWRCIIWRMRSICACGFLMGTVCNFPFICTSFLTHLIISHPIRQGNSYPPPPFGAGAGCDWPIVSSFLKNHSPFTNYHLPLTIYRAAGAPRVNRES